VENLETVSQRIHWIAFTVQFYKEITWPSFIDQMWKEIPKIGYFTHGQENSQGIRLYWHATDAKQGKHIILAGSTLDRIPEHIDLVVEWIIKEGYKVTRIDFAVDVTHSNFNPRNATYHIIKKQVKTHARKSPKWDDAMADGYTQYVGKKGSETFCRIYDKAPEMGVDFKWVRIEVVYSGERATPAAKAYLQHKDCRSLVLAFVDFPLWRKWRYIMQAKTAKVRAIPKPSNTRSWLLSQVAKSLAKEMTLDSDDSFYLDFLQKVREEYLKLINKDDELTF